MSLGKLIELCRKLECTGQSDRGGYVCDICGVATNKSEYVLGLKHKKWCPEGRIVLTLRQFGVDFSNEPSFSRFNNEPHELKELGLKQWKTHKFVKNDEVAV
jgi:hypothetical protein